MECRTVRVAPNGPRRGLGVASRWARGGRLGRNDLARARDRLRINPRQLSPRRRRFEDEVVATMLPQQSAGAWPARDAQRLAHPVTHQRCRWGGKNRTEPQSRQTWKVTERSLERALTTRSGRHVMSSGGGVATTDEEP